MGGAEYEIKEVTNRLGDKPPHLPMGYNTTQRETETKLTLTQEENEIIKRCGGKFDFDMITYRFNSSWPKEEKIGNINIFRVGLGKNSKEYYGRPLAKIFYIFQAMRLARKLHRQHRYSLTWSMMAAYAGAASLFFKYLNPRIPFFLTLEEGDPEKHILNRVGFLYPLWTQIFKKADYIQAESNFLAEFGKRHGAKAPVEVIPNGVDILRFTKDFSAKELAQLRQELNLSPKDKIIITTSRLVPKNAVDILIKAIAEIKIKFPNTKCLILGSGKDEQELKKLRKTLELEKEVIFAGEIPQLEIPKYLKISDIFVRASRSEGMGNSFIEAMAAGLPIIGTNVGGIPDFLHERETGLFVRVDDHQDLAEKILLLLQDENLRQKLIRQGKDLAISHYSWDKIAQRLGEIFNGFCLPR